ncbi:AAA family ATPase [Hymenobacter chitinivorans]|uniref:Putative ATPase n=1 Tax=Hymenobacter chitinivorans DSM 11115 TaxID=1121954 RepID=A0A2M9B9C2_9BACT|nr:AAA family ATPase [Hymenobacter chitinivorans]PJJ54545.1 putative ATPase [Hymenobacter chitinivorans DSM 11115]
MDEKLVVKNFGPIKDATVDFKKVTVFIGPTGGGKSTLAKLAAIYRDGEFNLLPSTERSKLFKNYNINNFLCHNSYFSWNDNDGKVEIDNNLESDDKEKREKIIDRAVDNILNDNNTKESFLNLIQDFANEIKIEEGNKNIDAVRKFLNNVSKPLLDNGSLARPMYIPSERAFVASIEYSWAGLLRDDIGLPKSVLAFANSFSLSRKDVPELAIPFLNITYRHVEGRDFISIPERDEPLMLLEAASGIQSVTPLLVLLEHLSRKNDLVQSFIIEEPELNLYPTAQRDLVYTLLEKCTQANNDLTITTHSPYVLAALNLCLYAHKVKGLFPHQAKKIARLIPEKYWLDPNDFSAYYVANGKAKSIFDTKTGLLSESQLDEVSGEFADIFDRLTDLRVPEKKAPSKAKPVKK